MGDHENESLQHIAEINKLVHSPARLMILAVLNMIESADFLFVEQQTKLTRGNLSSHMRKLEEIEYIEITKEFVNKIPRTLLRITKKGRSALYEYKKNMEQVLINLK